MCRLRAAQYAVQAGEIEQARHRLEALGDVADALGLERVDDPEERHGEGQPGGLRVAGRACRAQEKRPPHDVEEQQPGQQVHEEVEHVVALHVVTAERVVERERETREGAVPQARRTVV